MKTEIETVIRTEEDIRVSISEWDEDGVWMGIQTRNSLSHVTFTRAEAEQLLAGLQAVLAKEVTA
jgi:predicted DNA-binding transcriptional regulator YafY